MSVGVGAGQRFGCWGGVGGKSSLDGDQGQEYQRDETDVKLKWDACGKWVGGLLRHAFEEHTPWFVRLDSACWVCQRQYFLSLSVMRHFKESGHEGYFRGQIGVVCRGDKKDN